MVYSVATEYDPEHDKGVRWDSLGFELSLKTPVISERDRNFPTFADFSSPF